MVKRTLTSLVLEELGESALTVASLIIGMHRAGYGASLRKISSEQKQTESDLRYELIGYAERRRFYTLLSKLKKDGLVKISNHQWSLTDRGRKRIADRKEGIGERETYETESDGIFKIISFDIPEDRRKDRDRLRYLLRSLDFTMIQKSVWAGYNKIPEEMVINLQKSGIMKYLDVFAVSRTGTIDAVNIKKSGKAR
jgi:DNA-binding transcriptional regulator PaaX